MHEALNVKLASLPDDTVTYVGHEYTASNVAFSSKVEPDNEAIQKLVEYCKVRLAGPLVALHGRFTDGRTSAGERRDDGQVHDRRREAAQRLHAHVEPGGSECILSPLSLRLPLSRCLD